MSNRNTFKRYLVILADRQKGKFFTIYGDTFEDQSEEVIVDNVPQKIKAEYARPGKVQSHIREQLHKHLKHVGQEALDYLAEKNMSQFDGIVLGSHKELLSSLRESLPQQLKNKVVLEIISEMNLPSGVLTSRIVKEMKV